MIAGKFDLLSRDDRLSFIHHRLVASLPMSKPLHCSCESMKDVLASSWLWRPSGSDV